MTFSDAVNYLERLAPPDSYWTLEAKAFKGPDGTRKLCFSGMFWNTMLPSWDKASDTYGKEYDTLDAIVKDLTAPYLASLQKTEAEIGKVDVK